MRHMLTDTSFSNSIVLNVDKNRFLSAESSIYRPIILVFENRKYIRQQYVHDKQYFVHNAEIYARKIKR